MLLSLVVICIVAGISFPGLQGLDQKRASVALMYCFASAVSYASPSLWLLLCEGQFQRPALQTILPQKIRSATFPALRVQPRMPILQFVAFDGTSSGAAIVQSSTSPCLAIVYWRAILVTIQIWFQKNDPAKFDPTQPDTTRHNTVWVIPNKIGLNSIEVLQKVEQRRESAEQQALNEAFNILKRILDGEDGSDKAGCDKANDSNSSIFLANGFIKEVAQYMRDYESVNVSLEAINLIIIIIKHGLSEMHMGQILEKVM
ncbi:MAG: hypothetical protein EZS28_006841 [Streblomastix strix]|uniref:Uncharacterized protein n=1 Tax=Streblomastix strix TaxID=222440 RepID=A0A5J4WSX1_9EUKA|nr:MAG: hypothetical protein EZS28_006841 [Streblomastix strix]